jgi:hypothetical protein
LNTQPVVTLLADQFGFITSPYFSQGITLVAVPTAPNPQKFQSPRQVQEQQSESPDSNAPSSDALSEEITV